MAMQLIEGLPDQVVGVRALDEVEGQDYEDVLDPAIRDRLTRHDKIRLLYVLGPELTGYGLGAAWADTKLGARTFRSYERIAVVTDSPWIRRAVGVFGRLIPGEVRVLPVADLEAARAWITD